LIGGDSNSNSLISFHTSNLDEMNNTMNISFSEIQINEKIENNLYNGIWRREPVTIHMVTKEKDYILSNYSSEMKVIRKIKHPSILGFRCITSDKKCAVITEKVEKGSLNSFDVSKMTLQEKISNSLDIARGLSYLHTLNPPFIHGMIDSENLFVTKDNHIKIGNLIHQKSMNSPNFTSPEVLNGKQADRKTDIYGLGLIMWYLSSGKIPYFQEKNQSKLIEKITSGILPFSENEMKELKLKEDHVKFLSIIESCLVIDPSKRPSLDSIIRVLKELVNIGMFTSTEKKSDSKKSQKYEIIKKIGSGGQSLVFLAKEKNTGKTFALKKFNERKLEDINEDFQEVILLFQL
jgi:serine/threonine protein kinase